MTASDDPALADRVQRRIDGLTKPLGALGRLEALALQVARWQGTEHPALHAPQLVVFAADHGLAAQGVSAYPQAVTAQMVANMLAGGAAVSVLARQMGLALTVVDCGVATPLPPHPRLAVARVRAGTADSSLGPAMAEAECAAALAQGAALLQRLPGNVLLLGEMGIGNTSAASLLLARLTGLDIASVTGAGMPCSTASRAVQRPSPESATKASIVVRSASRARASALRSSSQERTTLPCRQSSAMAATSRSKPGFWRMRAKPSAKACIMPYSMPLWTILT